MCVILHRILQDTKGIENPIISGPFPIISQHFPTIPAISLLFLIITYETIQVVSQWPSMIIIVLSYHLEISTVQVIIRDVCKVLWKYLMPVVMPQLNLNVRKHIAKTFHCRWIFPNCLGAIDSKCVILQASANSGSIFYNYKRNFSISLMVMVFEDCHFL